MLNMKEPTIPQSKEYIKNNLKLGDWVRAEDIKKPMMVLKILWMDKRVLVMMGNGSWRVQKPLGQIISILEEN